MSFSPSAWKSNILQMLPLLFFTWWAHEYHVQPPVSSPEREVFSPLLTSQARSQRAAPPDSVPFSRYLIFSFVPVTAFAMSAELATSPTHHCTSACGL